MLNRDNQYTYLRKELLCRFYKFLFHRNDDLEINRIPYEMIPRKGDPRRCCIYKDREMIKYRLLALMGYDFKEDFDESASLYESFIKADKEKAVDLPPLTVIKAACSSCRQSQYRVTDLCRGCLARPCQTGCPVDAVTMLNNKAVINREKCINCGKCQRACPYSAIVYTPVPCEEICPVGAVIKKDGSYIHIDRDKCISCGKCASACPFGAIVERSHILPLTDAMIRGEDLTLLVAPALYGQLPGSESQIIEALKSLGFARVYELRESAEIVAALEGKELLERKAEGQPFMTTSCCPAYMETVKKHIPSLESYVSHTSSPMILGAEIVKEQYPGTRLVFAGPCLAKKVEASESGLIDYVLNFEELGTMLVSREIEIADYPDENSDGAYPLGRGFARSGGVAKAVEVLIEEKITTVNIDGLSGKMVKLLGTYHRKAPQADLVEIMACQGGCERGPCSLSS